MNAVTAALVSAVSFTAGRTDFGPVVAGTSNFGDPETRCACLALLHQTIREFLRAEHRMPSFEKPACRSTNSSYSKVQTGFPTRSARSPNCDTHTTLHHRKRPGHPPCDSVSQRASVVISLLIPLHLCFSASLR